MTNRLPLVTAAQMREIESRAAERGESGPVLMGRAAHRIADAVQEELGGVKRKRVLVLAGPGNNGGDGLWSGVFLRQQGYSVTCYLWKRSPRPDDAPLSAAGEHGLTVLQAANDKGYALLRRLIAEADLAIDAILGAGLDRDIKDELAEIVGLINDGTQQRRAEGRPLPVVAVDVPTGISSDSGAVLGVALKSSVTVTLGLPKLGLYQYPGAAYAGKIVFGDIGVTDLATDKNAQQASAALVREKLPARPADSNKGTFGRLLIVASSVNYIGAGVLATMGALRSGVGLATLAPPAELLPIVASKLTEATYLPLPADMGAIIPRAVDVLNKAIDEREFSALLIGCGLGQEKETASFLKSFLLGGANANSDERHIGFGLPTRHHESAATADRPMGFGSRRSEATATKEEKETKEHKLPPLVIDADALNLLAGMDEWWTQLPENGILTPHPGEMGRLLGSDADAVQADRVKSASDAAAKWKQIVVLKGANTVVAEPGGGVTIIPIATAALASGGTGDVLAGAIAGFLAQGLAPYDAAVCGAYVHGLAGQIVERRLGDAGVLAEDIAAALPLALREIKTGTEAS